MRVTLITFVCCAAFVSGAAFSTAQAPDSGKPMEEIRIKSMRWWRDIPREDPIRQGGTDWRLGSEKGFINVAITWNGGDRGVAEGSRWIAELDAEFILSNGSRSIPAYPNKSNFWSLGPKEGAIEFTLSPAELSRMGGNRPWTLSPRRSGGARWTVDPNVSLPSWNPSSSAVMVRPRSADPFRKSASPLVEPIPSRSELAKRTILPTLEFREVSFEAAVASIKAQSTEVDPRKRGIQVGFVSPGSEVKLTLILQSFTIFDSLLHLATLANMRVVEGKGDYLLLVPNSPH